MTIHIDTKVMFHFMRGAGVAKCKWEHFQEFGPDHVASVFKLEKIVRSSRYLFANHVATDGQSIYVHYRISGQAPSKKTRGTKRKRGDETAHRGPFEGYDKLVDQRGMAYRFLGNDPGRCNLSFMAEVLPDGSTCSFRLTRGEYYEQSGTNANAKLREKCLSRFNDACTKRTSANPVCLSDILENASQPGRIGEL
jgi:hypothetical protein